MTQFSSVSGVSYISDWRVEKEICRKYEKNDEKTIKDDEDRGPLKKTTNDSSELSASR